MCVPCVYTVTIVLLIGTAGTVPIERCQSQELHVRRYLEQQWYEHVNRECTCIATQEQQQGQQQQQQQCGDVCRHLLLEIRAEFNPVLKINRPRLERLACRRQLQQRLHSLRCSWARSNCHSSRQSPTCDHLRMPTELLPRVSTVSTASQQQWPYLSQATVDDVRAITVLRSCTVRKKHKDWCETLRNRLCMHASTGRGTVAEAIVLNDCYWYGSTAFGKL
jgi:hypothetical protein